MSDKINPQLLTGSNLAYVGDAYFELQIRLHLISKGITKPHELQNKASKFVSASAHARMYEIIKDDLSLEEQDVFRRGRNGAQLNHRKNLNPAQYGISSGLEALFGYLYLDNQNTRLQDLTKKCIQIIEDDKHE